ncbi:MAG: ATP-binding cassette domain-containing protein [Polyangiaceae bacterium]
MSFAYDGARPLLSQVSFSLAPGMTGLVGENGAGKSTLLALLARQLKPTSGNIDLSPRDSLMLVVAQSVELVPEPAFRLRDDTGRAARRLRVRFGLDEWALDRWKTLSPGERRRWQVASAFFMEPDILLLDEPTNHLDPELRTLLMDSIASFCGVGVLVSHDRDLLDSSTTRTLRVHRGSVHCFDSSFSEANESWHVAERATAHARELQKERVRTLERHLSAKRATRESAEQNLSTKTRAKGVHDHDGRGALAKGRAAAAEKK